MGFEDAGSMRHFAAIVLRNQRGETYIVSHLLSVAILFSVPRSPHLLYLSLR